MSIKSLLFVLFLCLCLVWVGAALLHPGPEFQRFGLLWTAYLLIASLSLIIGVRLFGWWRLWRSRAAARPAAPSKPLPVVHEDDAALAALLAEANAALARAPGYAGVGGEAPLSRLPIYLLIGPEGAGKTSTFLHSGVEPQALAGQGNPTAVTPTRLCNLWLAKRAVFVEISGRLFSGDIGRWSQFLKVLEGKRSIPVWRRLWREPDTGLNFRGVIGFCDVKELSGASADPQRLERSCRDWQERLRAISDVFGKAFPVYVVFTKSDKLPFFSDFFGRLPESEVNQVLGCTLPLFKAEPSRAGEAFAEAEAKRLTRAFRPLYQSLADRRLTHLAHEPNPARKPGIYEFPRELKRIRTPLIQFLTDVFRPHALRPVPLLRGFYLTATQTVEAAVAAPAAMGADWPSPNLDMETTRMFRGDATQIFNPDNPNTVVAGERKRTASRWIFASDLFHQVVLADQPPPAAPSGDGRLERYRQAVFASVCGLCVLLGIAFATSWMQNRQLLQEVAAAGSAGMSKGSTFASTTALRSLDGLRGQVERLQNGATLSYHWGLYTGNAILNPAAQAYFRRFQLLLLNDLNEVALRQLRKLPSAPNPEDPDEPAYSLLRTHLMISSGRCKPESKFVSKTLTAIRGQYAPESDSAWQYLADRQIAFYSASLAEGNPCRVAEDTATRDYARQYLQKVQGIDRIYQRILLDADRALGKPQRFSDLSPNYKDVLTGPDEIGVAFSHAGWQFVQKAAKEAKGGQGESCVVSNTSNLVADVKQDLSLEKALQKRYAQDYIGTWQKFVAAFAVLPYKNAADAEKKLAILADYKSPLLALFAMTSNQTDFSVTPQSGVVSKLEKKVTDFAAGSEKKANDIIGSVPDKQEITGPSDITRFFQPVRQVVPPASERWINEKNSPYMDALAGLRSAIQAISRSADNADPQLALTASQAIDKADESVRQLAKTFNPEGVGILNREVTRLLEEPILHAKPLATPPAPDSRTTGEMRKFCSAFQPVLRKYPFNPAASETSPAGDLTVKELQDYFAPQQGKIWKLQSSVLAEYTILDGGIWKANPAAQKQKASQELLDFLNWAQKLKNAFFAHGGPNPSLSYVLRPVLTADSQQSIELQIDGQSHTFNRTALMQHPFTWPAPAGAKAVAIGNNRVLSSFTGFSAHSGLWAVFRLLADAESRAPNQKSVEWKKTRSASGELQTFEPSVRLEFVEFPGGVDIFNSRTFENVRCPTKPVQ